VCVCVFIHKGEPEFTINVSIKYCLVTCVCKRVSLVPTEHIADTTFLSTLTLDLISRSQQLHRPLILELSYLLPCYFSFVLLSIEAVQKRIKR
jgi:hypothetical protein